MDPCGLVKTYFDRIWPLSLKVVYFMIGPGVNLDKFCDFMSFKKKHALPVVLCNHTIRTLHSQRRFRFTTKIYQWHSFF